MNLPSKNLPLAPAFIAAVLVLLSLGACKAPPTRERPIATPPPQASPVIKPVAPPAQTVERAPTPVAPNVPAQPPLVSRTPTPIPAQVISLNGNCAQQESDGFREQATLQVEGNVVSAMNWKLWVGKRGACSFDFSQFTQSQRTPHIELREKDGGACRLLIYQNPKWITLAHASCQKYCTGDIYDEAWPVMFDRSGKCGRIG
jgi:hypothetical protein